MEHRTERVRPLSDLAGCNGKPELIELIPELAPAVRRQHQRPQAQHYGRAFLFPAHAGAAQAPFDHGKNVEWLEKVTDAQYNGE